MVQPVSRSGIEGRAQLPLQQATTPDRQPARAMSPPAPRNSPVMTAPDPPASTERIVLLRGGLGCVAQQISFVEGGAQDAVAIMPSAHSEGRTAAVVSRAAYNWAPDPGEVDKDGTDASKASNASDASGVDRFPPDFLRAAVEWRPRECSICLGEICHTDHRGVAHPAGGCTHGFHWDCLCDWLAYKSTCPNCRQPLHKFGVCEITGAQDIESDADLNSIVKLHVPTKRDGQDAVAEAQLNSTQHSSYQQRWCASREQRAGWVLIVVLCIGVAAFVLTILMWDSGSGRSKSRLHAG